MAPLGIPWKKGFATGLCACSRLYQIRLSRHVRKDARARANVANYCYACALRLPAVRCVRVCTHGGCVRRTSRRIIRRAISRLIPFSLITTSDPQAVFRSHPKSNHRASPVNPSRQFLSDCMSIRSISQPKFGDSFAARRARSTRKNSKSIPPRQLCDREPELLRFMPFDKRRANSVCNSYLRVIARP